MIFHYVLNYKVEMFIYMRHVHCWYCPTFTLIKSYTDSYWGVYDLCGGIIHIKISLISIYDIDDDISKSLDEDKLYACNMINGWSYHN
jgi:hypothetical protein